MIYSTVRQSLLLLICTFFAFSCAKPDKAEEGPFGLSISSDEASYEAGSRFLKIECDGAWTLKLEFEEGTEVAWARLSKSADTGSKTNVSLSWDENTDESERSVHVVLKSGQKEDDITFVQKGKPASSNPGDDSSDDPGHDVTPPSTNPKGTDPSGYGWMELPATDNDELIYRAHYFKHTDNKTYRNYSYGYSVDDVISIWVAYPMCDFYIKGNEGRYDKYDKNIWAYDPYLGVDSPAPFYYYAGDYDRGHLLASNDRQLVNKPSHSEANKQTFYGTNVAPMITGNAFNSGPWGALELRINGLSKGVDTLYVVTGCDLAGSRETSPDSDGKDITVPVGFWKACLAYHEASTYGSKWLGAGYYLEHTAHASSSITKTMSMPLEELEKKVGLKFFVNLPEKIGEAEASKVKKQNPDNVNFWW